MDVGESVDALVTLHDDDEESEAERDTDVLADELSEGIVLGNHEAAASVAVGEEQMPIAAQASARSSTTAANTAAQTITSLGTSLTALELSGSLDSRMNCMMEELLSHVKQLKTMVSVNQVSSASQSLAAPSDSENHLEEAAESQQGGQQEALQESTRTSENSKEKEAEEPEADSVGDEAASAEEEGARDGDEEIEVYMDAPTRPSSTVIDIEISPEDNATNTTSDEAPAAAQEESNVSHPHMSQHSSTYFNVPPQQTLHFAPVFTTGQTAPVFFSSCRAGSSSAPPAPPANGHTNRSGNVSQSEPCRTHYSEPQQPGFNSIPLPFPPAFPVPQTTNPSTGSHVQSHDSAGGLPEPLIPEVTQGAKHAALLGTLGAAAQAISDFATTIVPDVPLFADPMAAQSASGNSATSGDKHKEKEKKSASSSDCSAGQNDQSTPLDASDADDDSSDDCNCHGNKPNNHSFKFYKEFKQEASGIPFGVGVGGCFQHDFADGNADCHFNVYSDNNVHGFATADASSGSYPSQNSGESSNTNRRGYFSRGGGLFSNMSRASRQNFKDAMRQHRQQMQIHRQNMMQQRANLHHLRSSLNKLHGQKKCTRGAQQPSQVQIYLTLCNEIHLSH